MCDLTSNIHFAAHLVALKSSAVSEAGAVAGGNRSKILMVPGVHPFTAIPRRPDLPGHKTEAEQEM